MTIEDSLSPAPIEEMIGSKTLLTLNSEVICAYCGSGGATHDEVFENGACGRCGAGGSEYLQKTYEVTQKDLDETILIISTSDFDDQLPELMKEIRRLSPDVKMLKGDEILTLSAPEARVDNFSQVAQGCLVIFMIVSGKEEQEMTRVDEAEKKAMDLIRGDFFTEMATIIPILTKEASQDDLPPLLRAVAGSRIGGPKKGDNGRSILPFESIVKYVEREMKKKQSS